MNKSQSNAKKIYDYQNGKNKFAEDITIGEAKNTAAFLNMEFTISENRSYPGSSAELDVQLYPTETTFVFFDRWEEAYNNDQDLRSEERRVGKESRSSGWTKKYDKKTSC